MDINYEKIIYEEVVLQIVEARKEQKINQEELADLLGVSLSTYASMEQLRSKFSFERMLKVCKHLKIHLVDIYQKVERKVLGASDNQQPEQAPITDIVSIQESPNINIEVSQKYMSNLTKEVAELRTMLQEVLNRLPDKE